jgi:hypothetical protein
MADQSALQATVPAILNRPHPLVVELRGDPQRVERPVVRGRDRQLPARGPSYRIQRDKRVLTLVRVHPDHDHLHVPSLVVADRADLRRTHLSWGDATLLCSHAGDPRRRRATRQKPVRPRGRQAKRESARRRPTAKPTSRTTPTAGERQLLTKAKRRGRRGSCLHPRFDRRAVPSKVSRSVQCARAGAFNS